MTGAFTFQVNSRDDLVRLIALTSRTPDARHRLPLLQAVLHGTIGLQEPRRVGGSRVAKEFIAAIRKPAVLVIGDDDDAPTGPEGWPCARLVLGWARMAIVHSAGAGTVDYADFVTAACMFGRVVLIETNTANDDAWRRATSRWAPSACKTAFHTAPGQVHPIPARPEEWH